VSLSKEIMALVKPVVSALMTIDKSANAPASSGLVSQTYSCSTQPGTDSKASSTHLLLIICVCYVLEFALTSSSLSCRIARRTNFAHSLAHLGQRAGQLLLVLHVNADAVRVSGRTKKQQANKSFSQAHEGALLLILRVNDDKLRDNMLKLIIPMSRLAC